MEVILGRGVRFASVLGISSSSVAKHFSESIRCVCCTDRRRWQARLSESRLRCGSISCSYVPLVNCISVCQRPFKRSVGRNDITLAHYSDLKQPPPSEECKKSETEQKVSVFKKMKQLTKDYWHVLIPVHIVTSLGWVAIFYIAVKNGVDVVKILEYMNLSEKYLESLRNSSAGNWAVTYALYKIFTPVRYTVTVGGTTLSIRYLNKLGVLKASSFKKHPQEINKTIGSSKSGEGHKGECKREHKGERQTEPPKT